MIWEAVDTILDKAWETNSRALIMLDDMSKICLTKKMNKWKVYSTLNILCICDTGDNKEYYYDISKIRSITILFDESRRNKEEKTGVE